MIKVESLVEVYEVAGKETPTMNNKRPQLSVSGHWLEEKKVVLKIGDGESITVIASDLRAALDNATNRGSK